MRRHIVQLGLILGVLVYCYYSGHIKLNFNINTATEPPAIEELNNAALVDATTGSEITLKIIQACGSCNWILFGIKNNEPWVFKYPSYTELIKAGYSDKVILGILESAVSSYDRWASKSANDFEGEGPSEDVLYLIIESADGELNYIGHP